MLLDYDILKCINRETKLFPPVLAIWKEIAGHPDNYRGDSRHVKGNHDNLRELIELSGNTDYAALIYTSCRLFNVPLMTSTGICLYVLQSFLLPLDPESPSRPN